MASHGATVSMSQAGPQGRRGHDLELLGDG